jgi:PAS domain S-box-containing protein
MRALARMQAALKENGGLLDRLREANVLGVVASSEQGAFDANDAFLDIIGYSTEDLTAGRISYQAITTPESADRDREAFEELLAKGSFQPYEKEYLHRDGHRLPVLVGGAAVDTQPLRWVTFVVDLTARQRAEQERAALLAREQAARAEADSTHEQLAFLLRASAFAAATRNRHELLEHAAQLVVPGLADHCVVYLPSGNDALYGASVAHRDPERAAVLARFRDQKVPAAGPMATQVAYTTGTTQILRGAVGELRQWSEMPAGLGEALAQLRPDTVLAAPLMVQGRPAGVLTLARDADRPGFTENDVEVAEEFARRLADAMANAETLAREHTIAETLQRAVLPDAFPDLPGLDLATSYLPASDGVHVGGDWYDVFLLCDNRVGLVIGDVAGHSINSASIMGQVRSMLRAYAIDRPDPGDVLQRTNAALLRLLPDAIASAAYAVLDLTTGELLYANAGHPPPLLITSTGDTEYLDDAPGVLLGAWAGISVRTSQRRLAPGTALLLYTDGLIEDPRRDIDEGLDALAGAVRRSGARTADQIRAAAESLPQGESSRADDVCLLAARLLALRERRQDVRRCRGRRRGHRNRPGGAGAAPRGRGQLGQWPRAIHSPRCGASVPIVVLSPWPVWTTVSGSRTSRRSRIEAMIVPKSEKDRPVAPGPPENRVSPLNSQPWPGTWKHTAPREWPGVCRTVSSAPATAIFCPSASSRSGTQSG